MVIYLDCVQVVFGICKSSLAGLVVGLDVMHHHIHSQLVCSSVLQVFTADPSLVPVGLKGFMATPTPPFLSFAHSR